MIRWPPKTLELKLTANVIDELASSNFEFSLNGEVEVTDADLALA